MSEVKAATTTDPAAATTVAPAGRSRFEFIDEFRGLVGVLMALGHSNYYFNSVWLSLDPVDPFFADWGQFALRYMGYLCAPGFLMMNGAMVYWLYVRGRAAGLGAARTRWRLVKRGLFLIVAQLVWVNASWSGFARLRLDHFGIIATIGASMLLLTLVVGWRWWGRLLVGIALFLGHPFLLRIPYDLEGPARLPMQLLVDAGSFNKYPILPWCALAVMGSVLAHFWFERWRDPAVRARRSLLLGLALVGATVLLRLGRGFGNIFPYADFGTWSFFLVQKYPPSLVHQLWFCGSVVFMVGLFIAVDQRWSWLRPLGIVGRVPLFFYAVHIPLLAIFTRHLGLYFREGAVLASLLGWVGLLLVMMPVAVWFGRVKRRSRHWLIRLI